MQAVGGVPAAEADVPPCHRQPGAPSGAASDAPAGGCDGAGPCCSRWLNNPATLRLADPAPLRTLLPIGANALPALPVAAGFPFASDPPDLGPVTGGDPSPPSPRPSAAFGQRGPPPASSAA